MTDPAPRKRTRRTTTPAAPVVAAETTTAAPELPTERPVVASACVLPGCDDTPEWRGLCAAHRQTHRGLAVEEATR